MRRSKKVILSVVTAAVITATVPFSASAQTNTNELGLKTQYFTKVTTFKSKADVQLFFESFLKDLKEKMNATENVDKHYEVEKEAPSNNTNNDETIVPKEEVQNTTPVQVNPPSTVDNNKTSTETTSISQFERQVIELTNAERVKQGLQPLTLDTELSKVAREKSNDMKAQKYFSHTSPTYGSPFDMMKQFGITYRSAGENIAMGQRSPEEVVNAWMNSPGHRANIMNNSFTHIGVGHISEGNYWTQMFIGK